MAAQQNLRLEAMQRVQMLPEANVPSSTYVVQEAPRRLVDHQDITQRRLHDCAARQADNTDAVNLDALSDHVFGVTPCDARFEGSLHIQVSRNRQHSTREAIQHPLDL